MEGRLHYLVWNFPGLPTRTWKCWGGLNWAGPAGVSFFCLAFCFEKCINAIWYKSEKKYILAIAIPLLHLFCLTNGKRLHVMEWCGYALVAAPSKFSCERHSGRVSVSIVFLIRNASNLLDLNLPPVYIKGLLRKFTFPSDLLRWKSGSTNKDWNLKWPLCYSNMQSVCNQNKIKSLFTAEWN